MIAANCRVPDLVLGDLRAMVGTQRSSAPSGSPRCSTTTSSRLRRRRGRDFTPLRGADPRPHRGAAGRHVRVRPRHRRLRSRRCICTSTIEIARQRRLRRLRRQLAAAPRRRDQLASTTARMRRRCIPFKCALAPESPEQRGRCSGRSRRRRPRARSSTRRFPAPVKARAKTTNNLNQVIFGALWPIFGERVQAGGGGIWPLVLMGDDARARALPRRHAPARRPRRDARRSTGWCRSSYPENSTITPCEILETEGAGPVHEGRSSGRTAAAPAGIAAGSGRRSPSSTWARRRSSSTSRPTGSRHGRRASPAASPDARGHAFSNGEELTAFPPMKPPAGRRGRAAPRRWRRLRPAEERAPEAVDEDVAARLRDSAGDARVPP